MLKLPDNLLHECDKFWPPPGAGRARASKNADPISISIVTSFFDLGRGEWKVHGGNASPFQRSVDHYFQYFSHLAKLKNPMVIFVAPEHAQQVVDLRKAAGLERITTVFTIADLFASEKLRSLLPQVQATMTPTLRNWTRFPKCPEYNYAKYVVLDALKSIFVNTAIAAGAIHTKQVAWLDFGYARDENCFDPSKPWRFDSGGKINLFHMRPIDDMPVFKVVQRGYVYFQGGCKLGPVDAWPAFSEAIDQALTSLLGVDLVDHAQTMTFMAWRANPSAYRIFPIDRRDWRVAIRFFNEDRRGEDVQFRDYRFVNKLKGSGPGKLVQKVAIIAARVIDKFV